MVSRIVVAALVVVLCSPVALFAGGVKMKPGLYEIKVTMNMQGRTMPGANLQKCYTKEDFEGKSMADRLTSGQGSGDCALGDFEQSGDTVTWTLNCPASGMKGTGEIIYQGDGYTGTMTYEMGHGGGATQTMTNVIEAKRLGKCK